MDVSRLLDEGSSSRYQKWLVALTALAIIFDGVDNQLLGVAIPSITADWHLPRSAFAPVVALNSLGMMIGGAVAGLAGDRVGRRTTLVASLALFGAVTIAMSIVDGIAGLATLRFVIGLGLGGAIPNAAALAAEYVPVAQRPLAVTLTIVCIPVGGTLAGLAAIPVLPALGWRTMFAAGGAIPLVAAAVLARVLPESPRYLSRQPARRAELASILRRMGHRIDADATFVDGDRAAGRPIARPSVRSLFTPDVRADTFALWVAFFSCLLAVYLGFSWLPSMLASAGFGAAVASGSLTAFNLGGVAGAVGGGYAVTRLGSRPAMLAMTAGAVVCAIVLSLMAIDARAPVAPILVMLTLTGGLINAVQVTMYALAANVYPTIVRATGVGVAVAIGRSGAILSGYAGPWALDLRGSASFFGLMAATLTATLIALALVRRHVPAPTRRGDPAARASSSAASAR